MSQATKKFTEVIVKAPKKPRFHHKGTNGFIGFSPQDTLFRCANVAEFVGTAADGIDHGGGVVNAAAVTWIMENLAEALNYESERVHNSRIGDVEQDTKRVLPVSRATEERFIQQVRHAASDSRKASHAAGGQS